METQHSLKRKDSRKVVRKNVPFKRTETLTRKISCLMLMVQIAWLTEQFTPQSIISGITRPNSLLTFSSSRLFFLRHICCSWDLNKYPFIFQFCVWVRREIHEASPRVCCNPVFQTPECRLIMLHLALSNMVQYLSRAEDTSQRMIRVAKPVSVTESKAVWF